MKKVLIVGAGVSGLVAGIYARKMGFEVEIYESHSLPGGLCTGWERKGFPIDGCIHWLTGSRPGSDLYRIWETCGALGDGVNVVNHATIAACVHENKYHYLYTDIDKMETEFLKLSPADAPAIKEMMKVVKLLQRLPIPAAKPMEQMNIIEQMRFISKYIKAGKYMNDAMKITAHEYISRFQSPVIRQLLSSVVPEHLIAYAMLFSLASYTYADAGWPEGGSLAMAQRMAKRFEALGGRLHLGTPVERIVVEQGKVVGLKLAKQTEPIAADYVIPAVDADVLLHSLLDGKYRDDYFEQRYADSKRYPVLVASLISFGVDADLSDYPRSLRITAKNPVRIHDTLHHSFSIDHYCYDDAFTPNGKSVLEVILDDQEFDYWKNLRDKSPAGYHAAKSALADAVMAEIVEYYPAIKGKIEMTDVATPLTFHRYCQSYKGAYMSFTTAPGVKVQNHPGVLKGIKNLYVAGQWVFTNGGLPMAAMAGKFAVQRICKQEKLMFVN